MEFAARLWSVIILTLPTAFARVRRDSTAFFKAAFGGALGEEKRLEKFTGAGCYNQPGFRSWSST